jgi:hypothetical protein
MITSARTPRPNSSPQPGNAVCIAPPLEVSSAPWAALLDQSFSAGHCTWVMGEDGMLLPVPADSPAAARRDRRRGFGRRRG